MPIVELVFGPTPEAFQANPADPALVKPAYDGILKQDGAIKAYYGLKSEDSSIAYGFYVWESLEHHQKFMNNKAEYQPVLDAVSVMFDLSRLTMVHIKTSVEPYAALEAPLLEVATCTLHPGRSIEELESVLNKLVDIANTDKSPISPVLATSGRVVENEHTMMFLVGWPSDQAHAQWFETTPRAAELSDQLHQIAELDTIDTVQTLYY
ncbi:hypothetical protein BD311DRAFT_796794 [Dichomitus squalens]|uniref:ABM domain-containing protein n=1 Tax=Dichomitus squalens TaxID=114155 RepID=A0A4Q9Q0F5_9APHY|nr:hypothetical protein BD311DRAFT_796794 [Dichomitus squalens]TBU60622.1 hypothetical protein BD310DRAFT_307704 [Dichomitus squalens]